MASARDYLRAHDAHLRSEGKNTRIRVTGLEVVIRNISPIEAAPLINQAVQILINRFQRNLSNSKFKFEQGSIETLSIRVALHNLYLYSSWTRYVPKYLKLDTPLKPEELTTPNIKSIVLDYFLQQDPSSARQRTAKLLAISTEDLQRWEANRQPRKMCTNNSYYRATKPHK